MVQRKVPIKLGIKPHLLKSDTQLVNHLIRPSSPQTHDKLKKIMKKPRPVKRSDELPPFKKKRHEDGAVSTSATHPQKQSPNYMKSTSSFEARKERSTSQTPKASEKSKTHSLASGQKGSRTSSLKVVRTLTKTPSFKPSRPSKKCSSVILCEDLDAQRATCSSTLKDSKFPNYLELSPGGTELEGTSAMKVCPYTYCSLNGHHHAPVPPLRCFLSARRRALKTQKSFKLGCLSPRTTKPVEKKKQEIVRGPVIFEAPEEVDMETTPTTSLVEDEGRDFFIEIYSKDREGGKDLQDLECSDIKWEEGHGAVSSLDDGQTLKSQEIDGDVREERTWKTGVESLYSELQDLYDEESVSSGAWSEENGDSESDCSYHQRENQDFLNYDAYEVLSSKTTEANVNKKMSEAKITSITEEFEVTNRCKNSGLKEIKDELQGLNLPFGDRNISCSINYQREETSQDSETIPDFAENLKDETNKRQTTIIYNIIQFNISVFVNGEKTERSETDKGVNVQVRTTAAATNKMETEEVDEEQGRSNEDDDANHVTASDEISKANQMVVGEEIPFHPQESLSNEPKKNCNGCLEDNKDSGSSGLQVTEQGEHDAEKINEEPATRSGEEQTDSAGEITSQTDATDLSLCNERALSELSDPSINLRGSAQGKKLNQDVEDSKEFNPRCPNFLPEVPDPDAETVDLRHQMMDERKNAEEWMVDFALQQAVTTLAPERKKKVALLVEAFEKVMPIPKYETYNRHTSKAFTNARPMQACS